MNKYKRESREELKYPLEAFQVCFDLRIEVQYWREYKYCAVTTRLRDKLESSSNHITNIQQIINQNKMR